MLYTVGRSMWFELLAIGIVTGGFVYVARVASPRERPSQLSAMERRFESLSALCEALAQRYPKHAVVRRGVRYLRHTKHMPAVRRRFFPVPLRATWHFADGEHYYIDEQGRPAAAFSLLPHRRGRSARARAVQLRVGRWGDALGDEDYDGGHLIGAQLGGYGRRANLVPQVATFNQGIWRHCEDRIAEAVQRTAYRQGALRLGYYVRAVYPGDAMVPARIGLLLCQMRWQKQRWTVLRSRYVEFENRAHGGSRIWRWLVKGWVRDFLREIEGAASRGRATPRRRRKRR